MKKIFTLFFFLLFASFTTNLFANTVLVSGYVKYANGNAVANKAVTISNDSISPNTTCGPIVHVNLVVSATSVFAHGSIQHAVLEHGSISVVEKEGKIKVFITDPVGHTHCKIRKLRTQPHPVIPSC